MPTTLVRTAGPTLEVERGGTGPTVLVLPTALVADETRTLADELRTWFDVVRYQRRGYGRSGPPHTGPSIAGDADDVPALLDALDLPVVHVVGASFGAAIGWELASRWPERVASLVLFEPPPVFASDAAGPFLALCAQLIDRASQAGVEVATDEFLTLLAGPGWEDDYERALPGSVRNVRRDAATFFEADLPAILGWRVTEADAARVRAPVALLSGAESGAWFGAGDATLRRWFTDATAERLEGVDHDALIGHPHVVADAAARHVRRHQ